MDEVLDISSTIEFTTNMVEGDVTAPFELVVSAGTVELELNLSSGWNWISVNAFQDDMDVNAAFSGLPTEANDYIKSQTTSAIYYDGFGFYPGFDMVPTGGYMLKVATASSFYYPSGFARLYNYNDYQTETFNYRNFEFNGSLTGSIDIDDIIVSSDDILYAYHNEELRGKAYIDIFPLTGEMVFNLMMYGNNVNNEEIHFVYYNSESNRYINLKETISFSPDVIIADAINPMIFTEGNNEIASSIEIISAYPNPFNPITSIDYYLSSWEEKLVC